MRWNDLPRSLLFGALVSASWLAVAVTLQGLVPLALVLKLHAAACVALYLAGIGPRGTRGARVGVLALAVGLAIAVLVPQPSTALLALGALLAVGRSALLWDSRPLRALVLELILVLGGLKLGSLAGDSSLIGLALGYWTFFLVQGAFFLVGGLEPRPTEQSGRDPFEAARDRALRVLEDGA